MKYTIKEFAPDKWRVIDETNIPIHNESRDGDDKPLIFTDYDITIECVSRLNSIDSSND